MTKRILGWLWFIWMVACLVPLVRETSKQVSMRFWENIGIGVFFAGCAAIGLMMGLGKDKKPPEKSRSHPAPYIPAANPLRVVAECALTNSRHFERRIILAA